MIYEVLGVFLFFNCKFFIMCNKYMFLFFYVKMLILFWKLENISIVFVFLWVVLLFVIFLKKCLIFIFCDSKCFCLGKLGIEKKGCFFVLDVEWFFGRCSLYVGDNWEFLKFVFSVCIYFKVLYILFCV